MSKALATLFAGLLLLAAAVPALAQPVIIGGSLGLTGQYARLGEELNRGLEIWREDVNARGGLLGRPVEFKLYDDQSDPTTSAKLYERLIVQDKVDLLFSAFASPVVFAASAVTEKYKFPMVAAGASAQNIWERGFRYIFQIYPQPAAQLVGLLEVAQGAGLKTLAVATEDSNYTKELAQILVKMAKEKGVNVVFYEEYGKNPSDVSSLVLKAKAARPDLFFGATYLPESVLFVRTARELNFNPKLYGFTIGPALDDFVQNLGKDAELITGTTFWEINSTRAGSAEFVKKYQGRHKTNPPYQAAASYSGMQILEAAVKAAGTLDREKVRDALASIEVDAIFGPYKVDDKGAQLANTAFILQIQDGKRRLVWPAAGKDADLIVPTPEWNQRK
jgi:branched-chain amino acid transport system substrate-binding protein